MKFLSPFSLFDTRVFENSGMTIQGSVISVPA